MYLRLTEADGTGNPVVINAEQIVWIFTTNDAGASIVTVPRSENTYRPIIRVAETTDQIATLLAAAHV